MKINSIINRYIFKEMIPPFVLTLGFLSFVFLLAQILDITNMIVNYNASLVSVLLLLLYATPEFLQFTIPMSVMMAVLLTFLKMAADNEIIAVKAGGGNVYHLVFPVFLFSFMGFIGTAVITIYGLGWGTESYEKLVVEVASKSVDASLKEGTFSDSLDGIMFYVNKIDVKNKVLYDVFINDSRDEKNQSTVIAPKGKRFSNKDNTSFVLRLYDGVINRVNLEDKSVNTINFDTYDVEIDLEKEDGKGSGKKKSVKKNTISELQEYIKTAKDGKSKRNAIMNLHKRFSLPVACFALGILAMPLGLKSAFAKKSSGLGLGLVCFLFYYFLLGTGLSCGKNGLLPPAFAMWIPDIVMGTLGIVFLFRVAREKTIGIGYNTAENFIRSIIYRVKNRAGKK